MDADRWRTVDKIYREAQAIPPERRLAFLATACAGDAAMRREIELMFEQAASFEGRLPLAESRDRLEMRAISGGVVHDAEAVLPSGTRLGRYVVRHLIGRGGMGEVYRAADSALGRDVAIKLLSPSVTDERHRRRRFEQEVRIVAALNHPGIITVHDVGTMGDAPGGGVARMFLVTELLEGETLRERLSRAKHSEGGEGGALDSTLTIDLALQTAQALSAAHATGIVHRDLKPENLFLTSNGRIKILDFGLAKVSGPAEVVTHAETTAGAIVGTVGYMAPEQVRGQKVDARTDLFTFGAVVFEMLAGRSAFQGKSFIETAEAIIHHDPALVTAAGRPFEADLARIIRCCLHKAPEKRYASAAHLAVDLEAAARMRGRTHLMRSKFLRWWPSRR